jgi:hypothetical protein
MADMAEERQAAAGAARSVRAVLFEEFGGRDADPEEAYLAEVEGADIYTRINFGRIGRICAGVIASLVRIPVLQRQAKMSGCWDVFRINRLRGALKLRRALRESRKATSRS